MYVKKYFSETDLYTKETHGDYRCQKNIVWAQPCLRCVQHEVKFLIKVVVDDQEGHKVKLLSCISVIIKDKTRHGD